MGKRVTHLIVGLGKGGAETMLYQVLKYRVAPEVTHRVVSLGASRYYEEPIRALGIEVTELPLSRRPLTGIWRLYRILRQTDTLYCWMYHANFLGWIVGRAARVPRIVWCIRHPTLDPALDRKRTLRISAFCAKRSSRVAAVTYNGEKSRMVHEAAGYCREKGVVLDNGCDCEEYAPTPQAAAEVRRELGIPPTQRILLSVTRDHPGKDVPTFLKAFAELRRDDPDVVAVLCGGGIDTANESLAAVCLQEGLVSGKDVFFLGRRHDVPRLLAACDVYVLHSAAEAFPNALLQAMACGCLCVTTDVGDARRILGREAYTVEPRNSQALCLGIEKLLALDAPAVEQMRAENRRRVQERFDIRQIVRQYEELY